MKRILFLVAMLYYQTAMAFPVAPFNALEVKVPSANAFMESSAYDFEGIVKLSNCSGSLIRFAGQPDTSNALVLTNGHCVGRSMIKPGKSIKDKRVRVRMKIANKAKKFFRVKATKLLYGTMTGTDAAIYQLNKTYQEIAKNNIEPFEFSAYHPTVGTDIEIISGFWEIGYSCAIDDFVFNLKESKWIFLDSIRYTSTGCHVKGGTSGSPIIEKGTRVVIGVNNTANESGKKCDMNNPCEIDEDGEVRVTKGASYGQQTYNFYACLTPDFRIDPSIEGCTLTK